MIILEQTNFDQFSNGKLSVNVEKPIDRLVIEFGFALDQRPIYGALATMLPYTLGGGIANRHGDNVRIFPDIPLDLAAEFCQVGEGAILCEGVVDTGTNRVETIRLGVNIGHLGSLSMNGDETIDLQLSGLANTDNANISIYGLETKMRTPAVKTFNQLSVPPTQREKGWNSADAAYICLKADAAILEFQPTYTNGRTPILRPAELKYIGTNVNDVVSFFDSPDIYTEVHGFDGWWIIKADDIQSFTIRTDGTGYEFYSVVIEEVTGQ